MILDGVKGIVLFIKRVDKGFIILGWYIVKRDWRRSRRDCFCSKGGEMAQRPIYSSSMVSKGLLFFPLLLLPSSSLATLDTGDFMSDLRLAADLTDGATP